MFGRTKVGVRVENEIYWLDLRGKKEFDSLIQSDRTVIVTGVLDELLSTNGDKGFLVNVTSVRANDGGKCDYVKQIVKVEIRGKLQQDSRDIVRPYDVGWYVAVNRKDYYLHLTCPSALEGAVQILDGQMVIVTGTLEVDGRWNIVHTTDIKAAPASPFKITFRRTEGVPDFHPTADVTFDSTKLSAKAADELRKLIGEAKFFELRSSKMPSNIPDPHAGYEFTLEMNGKNHSIWVVDFEMTPPLKSLVERLKELSNDDFCRKLIGLDYADAMRKITEAGFTHRLIYMDGVVFPVTQDWRPNRINLSVKNGKVIRARIG